MGYLTKAAVLVLSVLVGIGDSIVFVIHLVQKIVSLLFSSIASYFREVFIEVKKEFSAVERLIRLPSKKAVPSSDEANEQAFAFQRKRSREKRIRKSKTIVSFSVSFWSKLKYFFLGLSFSFLFIFVPLLLIIYIQDLPSPTMLMSRQIPQTTKIYDRNKNLLYQIYANQNRTIVPLSTIPKNLQKATIAIEDKDFYSHPGVDISAIIRSLVVNASGGQLQGGSTITQQLIKSALLSSQASLERKLKEAILAFWAERIYTKDQILEMYFNQVPYGGTAWGVAAASEIYFGKDVRDLDLAESAFLAGIPRAPTIYSPYGSTPTAWKKRQKEVLFRMEELGLINKQVRDETISEELVFKPPQTPLLAPHLVMYVKDLLTKAYGLPLVEKGGLTVVTTLDLNLQNNVQKIVNEEVQNDGYLNITNGAAMVVNPKNGDILAMVGSKDFYDPTFGNVNVATSLRQPGSSIKIITYASALSNGLTAATIIDDSPITFSNGWEQYTPVNYDGKFHGRLPVRLTLANSLNIPAVKVLNQIGIDTMVATARKLGIHTWTDPKRYGLSLTLGGGDVTMLDMTTVYGVFSNQGLRVDPNPILKITDANGNVIEEKPQGTVESLGIRVLGNAVTFIISDILADNQARSMEFGLSSPLQIPNHTVSVKTGTSDNKRDNWTFGYTPEFVVGVWVGNNDNAPMNPALASGITGAAPIWNKIMNLLLLDKKDVKPVPPENVVQKFCSGRVEYFVRGTENSINCNFIPFSSVTPAPSGGLTPQPRR